MKIVSKGINELKPNPNNPRTLSKKAVEVVKKSMEAFGYLVPIVIDNNNMILAGHTRYQAAKQLKYSNIDCVLADELTEEQKKIFNIVDNKTTELNEWDEELLISMLKGITEDMTQYGFSKEELDIIFKEKSEEEDNIPEPATTTTTQIGDTFIMGDHILVCGDSKDPRVYQQLFNNDEAARLTFTSPPYNIAAGMYNQYTDDMASDEYVQFNEDVIDLCAKHTRGFISWNISYNRNSRAEFIDVLHYLSHMEGWQFLELVCWNKKHAMPITSGDMITRQYEDVALVVDKETARVDLEWISISKNSRVVFNKTTQRGISNYWEFDTSNVQLDNHKACYPVEFVTRGIVLMTTKGELVLDPFGGSGTTLVACEKMGRRCRIIELDPIYCDIIVKRFEEYSGKKCVKNNQNK